MKKILLLLLFALPLSGCSKREQKISVRWATFNIRMDTPMDSLNGWPYRRDRACQWIKDNAIDVFGAQEVLNNQFEDIKDRLEGYAGVGVGRDDGQKRGEYAAIFYRTDKFDLLDSGTFWLSEYPDSVGRKGWDAACVRIATWAKLQDKATGKQFMAMNTHFDHVGTEARKQSALLIIRKIKELVGDCPAILTGDFNVTDESEAYRTITTDEFVLRDAYKIAETVEGVDYTFHNYGRIPAGERQKIDFIFVTPSVYVIKVGVPQEVEGSFLSDHNPHYVEIRF